METIRRATWGVRESAHLLNRAGFGSTPDEVAAAAKRDPAELVEELVEFQRIEESFKAPIWIESDAALRPDRSALRSLPEEERRERLEELRQLEIERLLELRAWWLYRMRYTKRPLQEKLALFWHGHFATSFEKVRAAYPLLLQNETLRRHANGNWRALVRAIGSDPAMLIYLDNAMSRAEHPNENFARELMELFTLGEGHYTEADVKEVARALTGLSLDAERYEFQWRPGFHDDGEKSFLGRSGHLGPADVVDAILDQAHAARFICRKLWSYFAYEDPEPELVDELATILRDHDFEFRPMLKAMFLSRAFYSDRAVGNQIKSPVQWLVGLCRRLDAPLPGPYVSALMLRSLGQELFAPPNVKGWDGGYAWISTTTLVQRYNFASILILGGEAALDGAPRRNARIAAARGPMMQEGAIKLARMKSIVDPSVLLPADQRVHHGLAVQALETRLFDRPLPGPQRAALDRFLGTLPQARTWTDDDVRELVHLLAATPQFQLT